MSGFGGKNLSNANSRQGWHFSFLVKIILSSQPANKLLVLSSVEINPILGLLLAPACAYSTRNKKVVVRTKKKTRYQQYHIGVRTGST